MGRKNLDSIVKSNSCDVNVVQPHRLVLVRAHTQLNRSTKRIYIYTNWINWDLHLDQPKSGKRTTTRRKFNASISLKSLFDSPLNRNSRFIFVGWVFWGSNWRMFVWGIAWCGISISVVPSNLNDYLLSDNDDDSPPPYSGPPEVNRIMIFNSVSPSL